MTPEASFKARLVKRFREEGAFVQTIETTTGRGVPDLAVIWHNHTSWIEVKTGKSKNPILRPEQRAWHHKASLKGVFVKTIHYWTVMQQFRIYSSRHGVIEKTEKGHKPIDPEFISEKLDLRTLHRLIFSKVE